MEKIVRESLAQQTARFLLLSLANIKLDTAENNSLKIGETIRSPLYLNCKEPNEVIALIIKRQDYKKHNDLSIEDCVEHYKELIVKEHFSCLFSLVVEPYQCNCLMHPYNVYYNYIMPFSLLLELSSHASGEFKCPKCDAYIESRPYLICKPDVLLVQFDAKLRYSEFERIQIKSESAYVMYTLTALLCKTISDMYYCYDFSTGKIIRFDWKRQYCVKDLGTENICIAAFKIE